MYYNGTVIRNLEDGVIFIYNESTYFKILQTMTLVELSVGLCQNINIVLKREWLKYQAIRISNNNDTQIMFNMYRYCQPHVIVTELYVEFEEIVIDANNEVGPSSYPINHVIFY